jgi:hypothetical protein
MEQQMDLVYITMFLFQLAYVYIQILFQIISVLFNSYKVSFGSILPLGLELYPVRTYL